MQEYQVTVNGVRFDLERPLFVLATQNPIEQEGTYPLPEAQLDRFMFNVVIEYPSAEEERRILIDDDRALPIRRSPSSRPARRSSGCTRWSARSRRPRTSSTTRRGWCGRRGRPDRHRTLPRSSSASGCAGAPARGPARRCCSAPRRVRFSRAAASSPLEDIRSRRAAGAAPPHARQLSGRGRRHRLRSDRRRGCSMPCVSELRRPAPPACVGVN